VTDSSGAVACTTTTSGTTTCDGEWLILVQNLLKSTEISLNLRNV